MLCRRIKDKIRSYITLVRPVGWVPFLFPLLFGLIDAGFQSLKLVYLMSLICGPLLAGGIYTLNFYYDIEADKKSDVVKDIVMAEQPFITGKVGRLEGLLLAGVLITLGLSLAWMINKTVLSLGVLAVIIGIIYSFPPRLKDVPFGDVAVNSIVAALCYLVGWSTFKDIGDVTIYPILWILLLIAATYLLTVVIDIEVDRRAKLKTTAIHLGLERAITLSFYIYLLSFALYVLTLVISLKLSYLLIMPLLMMGLFNYQNLLKEKNPAKAYRLAKRATITCAATIMILLLIYSLVSLLGLTDEKIFSFIW